MTTPDQPSAQPNTPQQEKPTGQSTGQSTGQFAGQPTRKPSGQSAAPSEPPTRDAAPHEESSEYRSARRKKIFVGLSFGMVIILILAITTYVDNRPADDAAPDALPATSIIGFWTGFCPTHNTIVADADAINIQEGESTEKYLDRLDTTLERQAADFRDAALLLNNSSVMMKGSEKQKKDLQELIDVLREGDKVFSERAKQLRTHPIRTQADMDELAAALKSIYERYSKAVSATTTAIGMGNKETREHIENLSECKQLLVQQSPRPTTKSPAQGSKDGGSSQTIITSTATVTPEKDR